MSLVFINSKNKTSAVIANLISALANKNFKINYLFAFDEKLGYYKNDTRSRQRFFFGPSLKNKLNQIVFLCFYVFFLIFWFFKILFCVKIKKSKIIILNNWNEKLIITPLAGIFKIKIFWLEEPETDYGNKLKIILFLFKINAKKSKLIVFFEKDKIRLKNIGVKDENLKILSPGIFLNQHTHQDSIFSNIVKTERKSVIKKYFTIGVITDFGRRNQLENLFQAVKKTLSIISNVQLIVVGDGEEKKQQSWIAKKLEINNLVWFVGGQKYIRKWLDGLDMFIAIDEDINLDNIEIIIKAMEAKLPIIGFRNLGLEDFFNDDFLLEPDNSEALAGKIIELYKNKQGRKKIGEENFIQAEERFNLGKMADEFEKLIK